MSDTGTSADQLKSAIGAVNALVEEARHVPQVHGSGGSKREAGEDASRFHPVT